MQLHDIHPPEPGSGRALAVPTKMVALAAPDRAVHPLAVRSLARRAQRGERIGVIIGHNRFDLYTFARLAQRSGFDPRAFLAQIELSRAFTCHQLHRRILTLDPAAKHPWQALYVLGLLETFYDESVDYHEAARLLHGCVAHLQRLARAGLPVLVTLSRPDQPGRDRLQELVARLTDEYWTLDESPAPADTMPTQLSLRP